LPPQLAEWLLERIEKGVFLDPSEATFVLLGEQEELEPHIDLRQELLRGRLDAAINDPRPSLPAKEVFDELRKKLSAPRPEPAVWRHQRGTHPVPAQPTTFLSDGGETGVLSFSVQ